MGMAQLLRIPRFSNLFGNGQHGLAVPPASPLITDRYNTRLTLPAGSVFQTDNFGLFASETLILGGTLRNNGLPGGPAVGAVGGGAGVGVNSLALGSTFGSSMDGGAGINGAGGAGGPGVDSPLCLHDGTYLFCTGGAGGAGQGAAAGGAGGTFTKAIICPGNGVNTEVNLPAAEFFGLFNLINGGAGGGRAGAGRSAGRAEAGAGAG